MKPLLWRFRRVLFRSDRKSTRLNSSHLGISYAVFCLKKKQILTKVGAVMTNSHIVYTSERHGNAYINKDALYTHTKFFFKLCGTPANQYFSHESHFAI